MVECNGLAELTDKTHAQGGNPAGSAAPDLCRQAARGWPYFVGLQHPERKYVAPGAALAWWHADLRENVDWQDHHLGC